MKKVIAKGHASTLRELIDAIEELANEAKSYMPLGEKNMSADTTYVTINSDSIKLALIEETLTDGSKVYNIEMDSVSPRGWK